MLLFPPNPQCFKGQYGQTPTANNQHNKASSGGKAAAVSQPMGNVLISYIIWKI
jgi:hypothetical protein